MKYQVWFLLGLLIAAVLCLSTSCRAYEVGPECEKAQAALRKCIDSGANCETLIRNSFVACKFKERK